MSGQRSVVVAGGTGFVGSALCRRLVSSGSSVTIATRTARAASGSVRYVSWATEDPASAATALASKIDGAAAIVNLAGESVAAGRWTDTAKRQILNSRVNATRALVGAISKAEKKPPLLINASAVGYYGLRVDTPVSENAPAGDGFLAEVCRAWEQEAAKAEALGVRVVRLRIGIVLGDGGALARMLPPFRMGLGGPLGSGDQLMSWIHVEDLAELIQFLIDHPKASGAFNGTAPNPVSNLEFSKTLAHVLGKPCLFKVPAFVLRLALGEMSGMLLGGQNAVPKAALDIGFKFKFPSLDGALRDILG